MAVNAKLLASFVEDLDKGFQKNYGPGLLQTIDKKPEPFISIPLGIQSIDRWMGGGIPTGRIMEIFGGESTGKTTMMLTCAAAAQRAGYTVFFIDAEHALDPVYAGNVGVDFSNNKFILSQPDYGEQCLQIILDTCNLKLENSKYNDLKFMFVVDSISALVPKSEYEGDTIDDSGGMARQAAMMSKALRQLVGPLRKSDSPALFVNQVRDNVGVHMGPKSTTPGGRAIRFYASQRIQIWKKEEIKKGEDSLGIISEMKIVKSKLVPPFKITRIAITFGKGIDQARMVWEEVVEKEIVKKMGAWYSYGNEKWQGFEGFQERVTNGAIKLEELQKDLDALGTAGSIATTA